MLNNSGRDWPRALVVVWSALAVVCLAFAAAHTLGGNASAAVGYGTAALTSAGAAVACDRWAAWRDLAHAADRLAIVLGPGAETDAERIERENRQGDGDPL